MDFHRELPSAPYSQKIVGQHTSFTPPPQVRIDVLKNRKKKAKNSAKTNKNLLASFGKLLLMEEILHPLIGRLSHYLHGSINPRWSRISSFISIMASTWKNLKIDRLNFPLKNSCFSFGWEEVSSQEGNFIAAAASTNTKIKKVRSHALNNWTRHHVWISFGKRASFHQKPIKVSLQRSLILWHTRSSIESSRRVKGSRPGVTFLLVDDLRTFFQMTIENTHGFPLMQQEHENFSFWCLSTSGYFFEHQQKI